MAIAEHLEKLRYFHKLCYFPSIQAAARSMGISQAALSKCVQNLEDVIGEKLFVRSAQGLTITASGKLLRETAEKVLNEALLFDAKTGGMKSSKVPGVIRIGMYDSIAIYFYASLANYIRSVYPSVEIQLNVEGSAILAQRVNRGEIDAALGVNLDSKTTKDSHYFHLWQDSYSFYVNSKVSSVSDDFPLIYFPEADDKDGKDQDTHLSSISRKRPKMKVHNFETVKTLTSHGLGIGVMPTQVARPLILQNILRQVTLPRFKQTFGPHAIGFLISKKVSRDHELFVNDLCRLGSSWSAM